MLIYAAVVTSHIIYKFAREKEYSHNSIQRQFSNARHFPAVRIDKYSLFSSPVLPTTLVSKTISSDNSVACVFFSLNTVYILHDIEIFMACLSSCERKRVPHHTFNYGDNNNNDNAKQMFSCSYICHCCCRRNQKLPFYCTLYMCNCYLTISFCL